MKHNFRCSLRVALVCVSVIAVPEKPTLLAASQRTDSPAAARPADDVASRVEAISESIARSAAAGKFTETIPAAREKLSLLDRSRGKNHWMTADARREVETLVRVASLSREAQIRYAGSIEAHDRGNKQVSAGDYGRAVKEFRDALLACQSVLGEKHQATAMAYNFLGKAFRLNGDYEKAVEMHQKALAIRLECLGRNHPATAQSYNNLALGLQYLGKLPEAETMHRNAIEIDLQVLEKDNPEIATSYDNLALNLREQGKYVGALAMQRTALAIYEKAFGEGAIDTLICQNNIALTLNDLARYGEAEKIHRHVLSLTRHARGDNHPETAMSLQNLGATLNALGRYAEAEELQRRALEISTACLGEGHLSTIQATNSLSATIFYRGRVAEAERMSRQALAACEKVLPTGHAMTGICMNNVAEILDWLGKYAEAEGLFHKAIRLVVPALGEGHPFSAKVLSGLATNLERQGRYAEVEVMLRRALSVQIASSGANHPAVASKYEALAETVRDRGRYSEAEELNRRALAIYRDTLGDDHPDTARAMCSLARTFQTAGRSAEAEAMLRQALVVQAKALGEDHPRLIEIYDFLSISLCDRGAYAEAETTSRRALDLSIRSLGEIHESTADSCGHLADALQSQARYAEAEAMNHRAMKIRTAIVGANHPTVAIIHTHLADGLSKRGRYAQAEVMSRKAVEINLKALGENSQNVANTRSQLATLLSAQGKYAEAEAMGRRALAGSLMSAGTEHPWSATIESNLGNILHTEGKDAEAEELLRHALATKLKANGENHPSTSVTLGNLAAILDSQGKFAEAEVLHRRDLAVKKRILGLEHPDVALAKGSLSKCLSNQGRWNEAESIDRDALAIILKSLGEEYPLAAWAMNNLGVTLLAQKRFAEAEGLHRRALAIHLRLLGPEHRDTVVTFGNLAMAVERQGRVEEAVEHWKLAARGYENGRIRNSGGLQGPVEGGSSPLPSLALALARTGESEEAWAAWERGLARGLAAELGDRAAWPLSDTERNQQADLLGEVQATDESIGKLLSTANRTARQDNVLEELKRQANELLPRMLDLERQLKAKYGALAGQPTTRKSLQDALSEDTAIVGWVDRDPEHWACIVRRTGVPVWLKLTGSGPAGAWQREDHTVLQRLRAALKNRSKSLEIAALATAAGRQRLEPLRKSLSGIKHLIVLNSPDIDGVPVEALMAAQPGPAGWDGITVSYAPSASMVVYWKSKAPPDDRRPTLLALGDPAYPDADDKGHSPATPSAGLPIARVVANQNADLNGLREGDILLAYNGTKLSRPADLKTVAPEAIPKKIPLSFWREGRTREIAVAAGPLGVALDPRPVQEVITVARQVRTALVGMRDGPYARLPGTRREVEAIAQLFSGDLATTVLGGRACEATVQELARTGKLRGFRFLHFATHGEFDPKVPYSSALILAPDPDRLKDPIALGTDGRITAEQIARTWALDAELVVLSACESGLGHPAGGEGYLGFAQPLFARGARSLVLSLWKVDDDATSLLMIRFYQNLLGRRAGLAAPLSKAASLAEAKQWLRTAKPSEVGRALAELRRGSIVQREVVATVPADPRAKRDEPRSERHLQGAAASPPFADPVFWAAFILIGDPD